MSNLNRAIVPNKEEVYAEEQEKATNDHTVLGELSGQFQEKYPYSTWALKSAGWVH